MKILVLFQDILVDSTTTVRQVAERSQTLNEEWILKTQIPLVHALRQERLLLLDPPTAAPWPTTHRRQGS